MSKAMKKWFSRFLPPLLVILAVLGAILLYKTRPVPKPREAEEVAVMVEVQPLARTRETVRLITTGTVVPAREVPLQAQVSGEVLSLAPAFLPGGRLAAGAAVVELDTADYELAAVQRRAEVEQARLALAQEQGMQDVARHEWKMIDTPADVSELQRDLVLRTPHLAAAEAALEAAEAARRQAELNLERTTVRAPFDAVVLSKAVDPGAQVTPQTVLGALAGTDEYWVEATLPADQLAWIEVPQEPGGKGSPVGITLTSGNPEAAVWAGYVKQLNPALESRGRLAQLLLSIPDPLAAEAGRPDLLLGSFVAVEISGPELDGVFSVPRGAVHDGRFIWIMDAADRLDIRPVDILWGDAERVLVREGLQEGERLVVSALSAPAQGMLLKEAGAGDGDEEPGS